MGRIPLMIATGSLMDVTRVVKELVGHILKAGIEMPIERDERVDGMSCPQYSEE